jgi:hypothetical protein
VIAKEVDSNHNRNYPQSFFLQTNVKLCYDKK